MYGLDLELVNNEAPYLAKPKPHTRLKEKGKQKYKRVHSLLGVVSLSEEVA